MANILGRRFLQIISTAGVALMMGGLTSCRTQTSAPMHPPTPLVIDTANMHLAQVDIFANGLGFFQYQGIVDNNYRKTIGLHPGDIQEVLASLVFQDTGGGHVGGVVFPTHPAAIPARRMRVKLSSSASLPRLLEQLRGTAVTLFFRGSTHRSLHGKIINILAESTASRSSLVVRAHTGGTASPWAVNLYTRHGLKTVSLSTVRFIHIDNPAMQKAFQQALAALARSVTAHHQASARKITLLFNGHGRRLVRFGYLLEIPPWSFSYRLILPAAAPAKKIVLQALAKVSNHSHTNWRHIRLDLLGDEPVASLSAGTQTSVTGGAAGAANTGGNLFGGGGGTPATPVGQYRNPAPSFNPLQGVQALAHTGYSHPAFDYTVTRVSLARGQSAMLPVLVAPITGRAVDVFDLNSDTKHPLEAIWLTNTLGKFLPSGPATVYRGGTFAGAAALVTFPPKARQLVSYAVDQSVLVHSTLSHKYAKPRRVKLVAGTLYVTVQDGTVNSYRVSNVGTKPRTVLLRQTVVPGFHFLRLNGVQKAGRGTHLLTLTVAGGGTGNVRIADYQTVVNTTDLASLDAHGLRHLAAKKYLPASIRTIILHAANLRKALAAVQNRLAHGELAIQQINTVETHLKASLASLAKFKKVLPVYNTMATELNTQELRYQQLEKTLAHQQAAVSVAEQVFNEFLKRTHLGPFAAAGG